MRAALKEGKNKVGQHLTKASILHTQLHFHLGWLARRQWKQRHKESWKNILMIVTSKLTRFDLLCRSKSLRSMFFLDNTLTFIVGRSWIGAEECRPTERQCRCGTFIVGLGLRNCTVRTDPTSSVYAFSTWNLSAWTANRSILCWAPRESDSRHSRLQSEAARNAAWDH